MLDGTGRWTGRPSTVDGRSVGRMGTWLDAVRMPALPEGYWMSNAMIYGPASGSEGSEAGRRELMGSGGIIGIDADGAHINCGWRRHMRIMASLKPSQPTRRTCASCRLADVRLWCYVLDLLSWSPNSPDQKIIENGWLELEKRVNRLEPFAEQQARVKSFEPGGKYLHQPT
ncbi:hypothetical protein B0H14DRAFT_2568569 [Mycena olivaceomarginata]|nr:hypothetical protein B0H14DRAFT_2568569 [Mycena olivaceomarginata]